MKNLFESVDHLDRKCYDLYNLNEDILMEHAASAMTRLIKERVDPGSGVLIVAGPGNNGGDGVATARQLLGEYDVRLFMPLGAKSAMCKLQLERFYACGGELSDDLGGDVVVDALFGSGLSKPLREDIAHLVERLNELEALKIACDIPTGIDSRGAPLPIAFRADVTVTMGARKAALYMDMAKDYVGDVIVADLGVSNMLYEEPSDMKLLEREDFHPPYRDRQNSNKGTYGHLSVIAGEKEGAAIMAASAALRFGAGLVTVVTYEPIQVPYELMHSSALPPKTTALAVGMGLGLEYSDDDFKRLVLDNDLPVVVDADFFYDEKILELLKRSQIVLTPHPKEFSSLLKLCGIAELSVEEIQRDRVHAAKLFCQKYPDAVLVLKGANPIIAQGDQLFVNPLGTNALAKGGSGDVLTGFIGALLAQGYSPLAAAIQGSLAHTLAARKVKRANYALTPLDLIEAVGEL
ncbi:MAG: bifunctional ADP-dependent NAD(P)H-hydrate dehydratase/NAD(P)H-hydrate epimerase [Epsilonproteobacteria bacterium]|nr:bifunctional ADP-dependent NAD(P)H-hydrate dehydratase/NAD(P)H-hydrate epimerase [Campylobacterota bacterium]NPA64086.1 NAD(P)H-hydrate dehydratase [Campylobacterota bacterium]